MKHLKTYEGFNYMKPKTEGEIHQSIIDELKSNNGKYESSYLKYLSEDDIFEYIIETHVELFETEFDLHDLNVEPYSINNKYVDYYRSRVLTKDEIQKIVDISKSNGVYTGDTYIDNDDVYLEFQLSRMDSKISVYFNDNSSSQNITVY